MTDHHLPSTTYTASAALAQLIHMAPTYDWAALVLGAHASALAGWPTTRNFLQLLYARPVPEDLVRALAQAQLARVRARRDAGFW